MPQFSSLDRLLLLAKRDGYVHALVQHSPRPKDEAMAERFIAHYQQCAEREFPDPANQSAAA